ncbi:MAG: DUF2911 domain-containing protein [Cytophagaceae bacterium]|nr:DUF2911 domain-containing protein [Cytophagaceae bacterium]
MKRLLFTSLFFAAATVATVAQKSPHETVTQTVNGKKVSITYGRPYMKGRDVWDASKNIAPNGKVWRTGADSSTVFHVDKAVKIEGKDLPAGRYALFTIPGEKEWTIIFNKAVKWGAYSYKQDEDVLRVTVPAKMTTSPTEQFTINVGKRGKVAMMWANAEANFKVQ